MNDPLDLETRAGLPDALRELLRDYPRAGWQADPNFGGLVAFWLERHLMFRRLTVLMREDAERLIDRAIDPAAYGPRLARLGSTLIGDLHGHHHIEDAHYFPMLARTEPGIAHGFELLDRDHRALDRHLAGFAEAANRLLGADPAADPRKGGEEFLRNLSALDGFLDRHLVDEEELVVPVVLKHGEGRLG